MNESHDPAGASAKPPPGLEARPPAAESPPVAQGTAGELDAVGLATRRLDLVAATFGAAVIATFEMGPAIAKRGFRASDFEVALITSGQCLGLLCSVFVAHLALRRGKSALIFWPELAARIAIGLIFFVKPTFALGFVILHVVAHTFQVMTLPARITIYRLNYPANLRGRIVGRNRQIQLLLTVVLALGMSWALDWSEGREELVRLLGDAPIDAALMINYLMPALAFLGLVGSLVFRSVPVREDLAEARPLAGSVVDTVKRFWGVWKRDRAFRRYESFFIVFGFANIMSLPLTQIHAVDALDADYFDLALINVVIVQGCMALTLVFWGRIVDRHPPTRIRAVLNLIFAVDFLVFAIAPVIEWVYVGRIFRGIAIGGGTLVWMLGSLYYAKSEEEVPVYTGIHTFLTGLRWAIAPFVGVLLKDAFGDNARPIFAISCAVVVVTAIIMLRESKDERDPDLPGPPMPAPRTTAS